MKIFAVVFTVLFLPLSLLHAQIKNSPLWKGERGDKTIYLFGTYHMGISLEEVSLVKAYLSNADAVFLEIDLNDSTLADSIKQNDVATSGSIADSLSKESWDKLVKHFANNSISEERLRTMSPWEVRVRMMSSMRIPICPVSLDVEIFKYAKGHSAQLYSLHDSKTNLAIMEQRFSISSLETQLSMFSSVDELIDNHIEGILAMIDCYNRSDLSCIYDMMFVDEKSKMEEWALESMLQQRNRDVDSHLTRKVSILQSYFCGRWNRAFLGRA